MTSWGADYYTKEGLTTAPRTGEARLGDEFWFYLTLYRIGDGPPFYALTATFLGLAEAGAPLNGSICFLLELVSPPFCRTGDFYVAGLTLFEIGDGFLFIDAAIYSFIFYATPSLTFY